MATPAGVVAGVRGDQAGAEEREERKQAPGSAATRPKPRPCPERALAQAPDDSADSARHRLRVLGAGLPRPRHSTPLPARTGQSSPNRWKWRRQPRGSTSSSTSSTVITPMHAILVVDHGNDGEVVVGHQPSDLLELGVRFDTLRCNRATSPTGVAGSARSRSASAIAPSSRLCAFITKIQASDSAEHD